MNLFIRCFGSTFATLLLTFTGIFAQETTCVDYRFYYSNASNGSSDIYEVSLGEGVADMTWLKEVPYHAHIAFNAETNLLYLVNGTNGDFQMLDVSTADGAISTPIELDVSISGAVSATFNADNKFLIGSGSANKVYQIDDEMLGLTSEFSDAPVNGGDISFDPEGNLLLATREDGGKLIRLNSFNPETLEYPVNVQIGTVPSLVTGIALMQSGDILLSANGADAFIAYAADGSGPIEGQSYATPFTLANGDMAAGCATGELVNDDLCYGANSELLQYIPGNRKNGQPINDPERNNPLKATGSPEINNTLNFVSLGFGGSIILGFDGGAALNGAGDDILVVETTYGDIAGLESDFSIYPESAEVLVSQDGENFYSVGSVFTDEAATFDIDAAGQGFQYIIAVKIIDTTPVRFNIGRCLRPRRDN